MNGNIIAVKKRYPKIYNKVTSKNLVTDDYCVEITKNSMKTLYKNDNNKKIYVHSKYNPIEEAKTFAKQLEGKDEQIVCIMGFGLGYHIREIYQSTNFVELHVLILNMTIFFHALSNFNYEDILMDKRVYFWMATNSMELQESFNSIIKKNVDQFLIHEPSFKCMNINEQEEKYVIEEFALRIRSNKRFSKIMNENFDFNKDHFDEFVNVLYNKHVGANIFIVSSGPSLEKNGKELLKLSQNKDGNIVIICVGSALRAMDIWGVHVDYVCMLESSNSAYDTQLRGLNMEPPLIIAASADKKCAMYYSGKKYLACQKGYELGEEFAGMNGVECVETGGSVATMALDIALSMQPNSVTFVGQDLSYTNMKTHAEVLNGEALVDNVNLRDVEGYYGGVEKTSKNLYSYRRWIQNRIAKAPNSILFINATEGGARIEGTKPMSLRDVIHNYNE